MAGKPILGASNYAVTWVIELLGSGMASSEVWSTLR